MLEPLAPERQQETIVEVLAECDRPLYDTDPSPGVVLTKAAVMIAFAFLAGVILDEMLRLGIAPARGSMTAEEVIPLLFVGGPVFAVAVTLNRSETRKRKQARFRAMSDRKLLHELRGAAKESTSAAAALESISPFRRRD